MPRFPHFRHAVLISLLLGACAMLAACSVLPGPSSIPRLEQPAQTGWLELAKGGRLGQTFVSRYRGLQAVRLALRAGDGVSGKLTLRLYPTPGSAQVLSESSTDISLQAGSSKVVFKFEPLPGSSQADYYMEIAFAGEGRLEVAVAGGETYLNGAAYQDGAPLDAQLAFTLLYQPLDLALGLAGDVLRWTGYLLAAAFLFFLPGWALMDWIWLGWRELDWMARLALAGPVGLALYPLFFLWAYGFHLRLGALFAWLPPLWLGLLLVWRFWIARRRSTSTELSVPQQRQKKQSRLEDWVLSLAFIVLMGVAAFGRLWAIRNLDVPLWGDSVQHDAITRLMIANGGLFSSWEPIAPYATLTVHYGFSAAAALFAWLLRISPEQSVLVAGQVLNWMTVLALYPLGCLVAKGNRWAGLAAVGVAGLLLPIPAIYVNWGRYAQLAGQVVLPVMIWITVSLPAQNTSLGRLAGRAVLAGVVLAGMSLCYYRAPIFYVIYVLAWGLVWLLQRDHWSWRAIRDLVFSLGVAAIAGVLLMILWLPHVMGSNLSEAVASGLTGAAPLALRLADVQVWRTSGLYVPLGYSLLAGLGALWGLWRRNGLVVSFFLWVLSLVGFTFGSLIHLPAANMIQNFAVLILVYIPVGVLCGYLFGEAVSGLSRINSPLSILLGGGVLLLAAVWGVRGQARMADPTSYALFTRPDVRAMAWIREQVDPGARFLVEGFTIYGGTSSVGADGGWWIPLLAGRQNTMPPQYALLNERPIQADYTAQVTSLVKLLESQPLTDPAVVGALCGQGVTHVYVGQRQGNVGAGVRQLYPPQELLESPVYKVMYHQDRVYIFALDPAACRGTK
jgi:hypothetical protein